jgi:deoxypyrimidine-specific 5' nucleotidase type C protein (NT5C)
MIPQVFVDMDGVLADFDTHYKAVFGVEANKLLDNVDWEAVRARQGFYADIPPMPDMRELWDFVSRLTPHPIVLTGVPSSVAEAPENKRAWVRRHLGENVEVRCCLSKEKCLHAKPGDVLIDDWEKYRDLWIAKGGRWITHISAKHTVFDLFNMGIVP